MQAARVDTVLRALSDPTRRAVFERVVRSEMNVVELTRESGVTQGAVSQHLKQLKQAGLVVERPEGRKVFYRARPEGLAPLFDWLGHYDAFSATARRSTAPISSTIAATRRWGRCGAIST